MPAVEPETSLDELLEPWRKVIGADYQAYRNHCQRVASCCLALHPSDEVARQKVIIAAAFHDLGIWTAATLDYLPPSASAAVDYLEREGLSAWREEITLMITEHHKLSPFDDPSYPLVEVFRRGDLVDFSLGLWRFGLPRDFLRTLRHAFPNAGFHWRLVQLALGWLVRHPLNPAPMFKR